MERRSSQNKVQETLAQYSFPLMMGLLVVVGILVVMANPSLGGDSQAGEARQANTLWSMVTVVFIIVSSTAVGLTARFFARLRGLSAQEQRRVFWGFTFAGPWIVGFLIFVAGPSFASLYYSFTDYEIGTPLDFDFTDVSWDNYQTFFESTNLDNYRTLLLGEGAHGRRFKQALFNSFYYALVGVPLQIMTALSMALLLNREVAGIRAFRAVFYLPVILLGSPAALLAWRYMFNSSGGFVNLSLRRLAEKLFIFDYGYRLFIYGVEGFNGFYAGLARGNPVGPLKYTLPAALAVLILITLWGEWTEGKRIRAWRSAQILILIVLAFTLPKGLVGSPVKPVWTYFLGAVLLGLIMVNYWVSNQRMARFWQTVALIGFGLGLWRTLGAADFAITDGSRPYIIALVLGIIPIAGTFVSAWDIRKYQVLGAGLAALSLIILIHAIPHQLDGGRLEIVPQYLTFGSTLDHIDDADYLEDVYPVESLSALWLYGLAAATMITIALLGVHYEQTRNYLLYGSLAFFILFGLNSFLDGRAYFQAFVDIAAADGKPNFHFALFHQATSDFPSANRVPLWLSNELWSKPSLILITMWSSGTGMLIFLAALKGVPNTFYEAAEVDGANTLQKFFSITLPLISPAMFYNVVIGVIAALQTFESVYLIRTPDTEDSLTSAAYFLFVRTFRQLAIGQGAAASWILAVIIVVLTIMQFRWSNWVHYEA